MGARAAVEAEAGAREEVGRGGVGEDGDRDGEKNEGRGCRCGGECVVAAGGLQLARDQQLVEDVVGLAAREGGVWATRRGRGAPSLRVPSLPQGAAVRWRVAMACPRERPKPAAHRLHLGCTPAARRLHLGYLPPRRPPRLHISVHVSVHISACVSRLVEVEDQVELTHVSKVAVEHLSPGGPGEGEAARRAWRVVQAVRAVRERFAPPPSALREKEASAKSAAGAPPQNDVSSPGRSACAGVREGEPHMSVLPPEVSRRTAQGAGGFARGFETRCRCRARAGARAHSLSSSSTQAKKYSDAYLRRREAAGAEWQSRRETERVQSRRRERVEGRPTMWRGEGSAARAVGAPLVNNLLVLVLEEVALLLLAREHDCRHLAHRARPLL